MKYLVLTLVSVMPVGLFLGCNRESNLSPVPENQSTAANIGLGHNDHDHSHDSGPHGGTIIDWGGGAYHLEFTVDHERQQALVYVLADDVKKSLPIKAEKLICSINEPRFQVELLAVPLEGESAGLSSRFIGQHDNFSKPRPFAGSLIGEVDGVPYTGDFKEAADDHGHDH